jgi:type I site-specific restriction endonuclease
LQNEFADLGFADYAVPIISEEGQTSTWLEQFQDSDKKTPVVATTAELLSTGVDVPACRNIVLMKPIASRVLFKQIIGRGSRVDPATGKLYEHQGKEPFAFAMTWWLATLINQEVEPAAQNLRIQCHRWRRFYKRYQVSPVLMLSSAQVHVHIPSHSPLPEVYGSR